MPEPYRRKAARSARPSPARLGVVRVDPDFEDEYPGGDAASTEAYATLIRTGSAANAELDRCIMATLDINQSVFTTLAVIDGAGKPLTPSDISERVLVASASLTATLDVLERRGWVKRAPNPEDRRSTLVEITADGRAVTDRVLPGIRRIENAALVGLTPRERAQLVRLLGKVLTRLAELDEAAPTPLEGRRKRPARLNA